MSTAENERLAVRMEQLEKENAILRNALEQRRSEELSHKADKLYAMGQLAAGVAHELRNPLTAVKGFVQLIKAKPDNVKPDYLEAIHHELERIEVIIKELLVLAKPQALRLASVQIEPLVSEAISGLVPIAAASGIVMECRFPDSLPTVRCEPVQLKQVYANIIQNAVEAMPEGGRIAIEGRLTESGEVEVSVADEGPGIPPERLARLGEPFYTTKEKGAGLGLMVSYKIMAEHGGKLAFNTGSEGTTVTITLPAC